MDAIEWVKLIVIVCTLGVGLIQASIALRTYRADHRRRTRQATIEHLNMVREKYRVLNHELTQKLGTDTIDLGGVKAIVGDPELWAKVKALLSLFEHMSVGANAAVFDTELLNRMCGSFLIRVFDRYSVYIQERRKVTNIRTLYNEYELLVNTIKGLRGHRRTS